MAIERLPTVGAPPAQPQPARDTQALQRAFFQAALKQASAPEAAPSAAPTAAPKPAAAPEADASEQPRGYRPGSLLDIRV